MQVKNKVIINNKNNIRGANNVFDNGMRAYIKNSNGNLKYREA